MSVDVIQRSSSPLFSLSPTKSHLGAKAPVVDSHTPNYAERVLEALRARHLFSHAPLLEKKLTPHLEKDLQKITAEELNRVLSTLFEEETASYDQKTTKEAFRQLSSLIPLEKLQAAIRTSYPSHKDALTTVQAMLHEALYFLEKTETPSPSLKERIKSILHTLLNTLETMLAVFGIDGFLKPHENDNDAEGKFQRILSLANFFSILSTALIPIVGVAIGGAMIGATLLLVGAISLAYPHFKPSPSQLPKAENWTKMYREHRLSEIGGRKSTVDEIAHALISGKEVKTHPMLIGKSGVGKTQTIKALVRSIERGEYPELKGKKVFYINTADIINGRDFFNGENTILAKISQKMGRHRDNIILVFDEIHLACKPKEGSDISEQLKTLLDAGPDKFPHVIGITTEEEYYRDIYSKNPAFARRFKQITIKDTPPQETERILTDFLISESRGCLIKPGIVQMLIKKTESAFHAAEPAASLRILSQCVKLTNQSQKSSLREQVEQMRERISCIQAQRASGTGTALLPYSRTTDEEPSLEEKLHELEEALALENKKTQHLFRLKEELASAKTAMLKTVAKVAKLKKEPSSLRDQAELNYFLLTSHFLLPTLEKEVEKEAHELGIRVEVTEDLIEEVIGTELENERKAKEAVESGKAHLEAIV